MVYDGSSEAGVRVLHCGPGLRGPGLRGSLLTFCGGGNSGCSGSAAYLHVAILKKWRMRVLSAVAVKLYIFAKPILVTLLAKAEF